MPDSELPEVARVARDLIRFDTTNSARGAHGENGRPPSTSGAYRAGLGLRPEYYEPIPRRTNLSVRVPGRDRDKPALVLHGHLDVVRPSPRTGASIRSAAS
jgi:acetylornithine deacetylase/succinyl-diaminopimelate desuccinylase-like protein